MTFAPSGRFRPLRDPGPADQQDLALQKWVESKLDAGMITTIKPSNLPNSALSLLKNATVRYDNMTRRPGSYLFTPEAPDVNPILALVYAKLKAGAIHIIRHTPDSIYVLNGASWDELTIASPLSGTLQDRLNYVDVLDTYCFSNNGADPIQAIDFGAGTVAQLGNAPAYRYITGFFNRVVGAALQGVNEVQIGWSADGVPDEWDPDVEESAGNTPLIDTPADLSDWIKGVIAFSNVMIVLREKTLWLATKQPIDTQPFYFYTAIPGIGCNCPFSVQMISGGIAWADARTRSIYAYSPGGNLESIGKAIESTLFNSLNDVDTIFSAYNATFDEYSLFIPVVASDVVQGWTYNFRTKAWAYNEYMFITCAADFPIATALIAIEDLVGTIEGLVGAINDLSPTSLVDTRAYGRSDGTIAVEDVNDDTDAETDDFPDGIPFETLYQSKTYNIASNDIMIAEVHVEYEALRSGTLTLEFSKDDGNTWYTGKAVTPNVLGKSAMLIFRRAIRCRRFIWRLRATAGAFTPISYEVWVNKDGASRR